jgi:adenylate cyclase
VPRVGRHRSSLPAESLGELRPEPDDVEIRLLGNRRTMRSREVAAKASVSITSARKFWHALGFPHVEDHLTVFTEADLLALQSLAGLVRDGVFDESTALGMTRAFARTTDRLAVWQVQLMAEVIGEQLAEENAAEAASGAPPHLGAPDTAGMAGVSGNGGESGSSEQHADSDLTRAMPDPATARAAAVKLADIADDLEPLLIYAWRRHLAAAISRMVTDAEPVEDKPGVIRCVGFADLVSFTRLVRRLSERELARMVQRFEELASDVVTAHGGRVIKTVGDEILFVAIGAAPAAAIALDLVASMAEDDVLPDVRVGMANGRVISRLGDVFGTTVNRASRLTAIAKPRTVLVDDSIAAALASTSGFEMSGLRSRTLRGIGPVRPWVLQRAQQTRRGASLAEYQRNAGYGDSRGGLDHDRTD